MPTRTPNTIVPFVYFLEGCLLAAWWWIVETHNLSVRTEILGVVVFCLVASSVLMAFNMAGIDPMKDWRRSLLQFAIGAIVTSLILGQAG